MPSFVKMKPSAAPVAPMAASVAPSSRPRFPAITKVLGSFWAAFHNEITKYGRQKSLYVGMIAIGLLASFCERGNRLMAGPETHMNGYQVIIMGAISAVTSILPLIAVVFSSVLVASETSGGTYRNILSRPIGRFTFLTAKITFAFGYVAFLLVLYFVVAFPFVRSGYSFGPVVEEGETIYSTGQIVSVLLRAVLLTLVPLFAITSFGILVSTAAKSLISSIVIGVVIVIVLKPIGILVHIWDKWYLGDFLFTSYIGTPLEVANNAAQGFSYEWFAADPWWTSNLGRGLSLSVIFMVIFLVTSYIIFWRRDLKFS